MAQSLGYKQFTYWIVIDSFLLHIFKIHLIRINLLNLDDIINPLNNSLSYK